MQIPPVVKKYWPYMLGGAVGLYLLVGRNTASASSQPVVLNMGPSDAVVQANAQLAAAQMQIDAANAANSQLYKLEYAKLDQQNNLINSQAAGVAAQLAAQKELGLAEIGAQLKIAEGVNYANLVAGQGIVAQGVAQSAATTIAAMNAPAVAAINAAGVENAAALDSAAFIAGMGFGAQADIFNSSLVGVPDYLKIPQTVAGQSGTIATAAADRDKRPGMAGQIVEGAVRGYTGGYGR